MSSFARAMANANANANANARRPRASRAKTSDRAERSNGRNRIIARMANDGESVMYRFGDDDDETERRRMDKTSRSSSTSSSARGDGEKESRMETRARADDDYGFKTRATSDEAFAMALMNEDSGAPVREMVMGEGGNPARASAKAFVRAPEPEEQRERVRSFLYPGEDELPDDVEMTIWEHLEELRERAIVSAAVCGTLILVCFCFAKDLTIFLEEPVKEQGVRFLQLGPGEYFFTTVKVAGYTGLLTGAPVVLYEAIAYVLPGLTLNERKTLGPIVLGSSVLFYGGIAFAYAVLVPAALKFFVGYAEGAVESLWSIDQYFEFVLVLLFSTGLSFQVPVIQLLLGQAGIVSSKQMLSVWRYVVVGSVVAAAVLTPSTDPFTQLLLAAPLMSLYLGGAALVGLVERDKGDKSGAVTMK